MRNSSPVPAFVRAPSPADGRLVPVLGGLVLLQALLGGFRAMTFLSELPRIAPSLLSRAGEPGTFSSLSVVVAVAAVAVAGALGERDRGLVPRLGAAGLWGLSALAAAGVALAVAGVATTRFVPAAGWGAIAVVAWAAVLRLLRRAASPTAGTVGGTVRSEAGLSPWDAGTVVLLLALVVPTVFPFVHFDAKAIWGCRAVAFGGSGSLTSLAGCTHPSYPPLFSLLMALGGPDPVLEGRLAAWLLVACHALFLRGAFARLVPGWAAAGTLWVVATGHVWVTAAMYYADVPLMAFAATAAFLVLGVPARTEGEAVPGPWVQAAAALLLAAAVLDRPDGIVYVAVIALAAASTLVRGRAPVAWAPFAAAAAAWVLWAARPGALRAPGTFLELPSTWRTAGGSPAEAALRVVGTFLDAWQGQWLSHYGLGLTVWVLALLAVVLRRRRPAPDPTRRAYGVATALSLAAVVGTYAILPFTVDVVRAAELPGDPGFLPSLTNFVRVGMGRMTIHLLPLYVAFALAALAALRPSRETGAPGAARDGKAAVPAPEAATGRS